MAQRRVVCEARPCGPGFARNALTGLPFDRTRARAHNSLGRVFMNQKRPTAAPRTPPLMRAPRPGSALFCAATLLALGTACSDDGDSDAPKGTGGVSPQAPPAGGAPQVPPAGGAPQVSPQAPPVGGAGAPQVAPTGGVSPQVAGGAPQFFPTGGFQNWGGLPQVAPMGGAPQFFPSGGAPQTVPSGGAPQTFPSGGAGPIPPQVPPSGGDENSGE